MTACLAFVSSDHFSVLAFGQIMLATGMALGSGSDTSYHFSVLAALGRSDEYGSREAKAARSLLISQATSALIGGAVATMDLRVAYLFTMASSLVAFAIAAVIGDTADVQATEQLERPAHPRGHLAPRLSKPCPGPCRRHRFGQPARRREIAAASRSGLAAGCLGPDGQSRL